MTAQINQQISDINKNIAKINEVIGNDSESTNKMPVRLLDYLPKEQRQIVQDSGIGLNNARYQPKNPNIYCANLNTEGAKNYGVYGIKNVIINGTLIECNQQTYAAVCDQEYVYYAYEIANKKPGLVSGTDYTAYNFSNLGITNNYVNWLNNSTCIFVKQDRSTGEVVLTKFMGEITGLPTTDITKYETTGDDITRGPFSLLNGHIYVTGQGQKYASIMKIRCSDFKLVWREVVPDGSRRIEIPGRPELTCSGIQMRTQLVIPPTNGRKNPIVIAGATAGIPYGAISYDTIIKLFGYYNGSGKLWCYEDLGDSAQFKWDALTVDIKLYKNI